MHSKLMERVMRLLAATIGALLISVSHPALAQENDGRLPQGEWQQIENSQQGEPQQAEQAAIQQPAMPEPPSKQAEVQPPMPITPEPRTEQADAGPPAMPEPQTVQAEVQPPAMPEPRTAQGEMQPPAMPEPPAAQAATQPPAMPQPQVQADNQDIALPRDARWTAFLEPSLGTRIDLPSAVFSQADGAAYRGVGRQFKTADGRAALAIYSQRNNQRDTPASYLRKNFSFPRATVSYERITRDFFAVSGVREGMIYYSRCNVSPTGATLHCFDLQFPARERTAWDAIVTRMSLSLRPLNRS